MDDKAGISPIGAVMALAGCLLLLVLAARAAFGEPGVQVTLLLTAAAVAVYASQRLTGRRVAWHARGTVPAAAAAEPAAEDVWRSERWIAEAVARGLRALDEWRLEQSQA